MCPRSGLAAATSVPVQCRPEEAGMDGVLPVVALVFWVGAHGPAQSIESLAARLAHSDVLERRTAAYELGQWRWGRCRMLVVSRLCTALTDADTDVRILAAA